MTIPDWLATIVIPGAVGWVISVERRLSGLIQLNKTVERIDQKTEMLVEHLLNVNAKDRIIAPRSERENR